MFSYLELENFKSFKKVTMDFRGKNKKPKNIIFLYGENGSGKTNIVYAFSFLKETIQTMNFQKLLNELMTRDIEWKELIDKGDFASWINSNVMKNLDELVDSAVTIQSNSDMRIRYGFNIDDCEGYYELVFDKSLKSEKLYFKIDKNRGFIFEIDRSNVKLNPKSFTDNEYRKDLENSIMKYWGKHTFLSILLNDFGQKNNYYLASRIEENIVDILEFFTSFVVKLRLKSIDDTFFFTFTKFTKDDLSSGSVPIEQEKIIDKQEEALNELLTSLYSDIKEVYYNRKTNNNMIEYNLFVKKLIGEEVRDINFNLESTGTKNIVNFLPTLLETVVGNVSIIDEADSGIHDILFNKIIEDLSDSISGQLIITTHNTTLLEKLNAENVYIIDIDHDGNKEINNLSEYNERIQKTHNIRSRYLEGMYGGVPITRTIYFDEIANILLGEK